MFPNSHIESHEEADQPFRFWSCSNENFDEPHWGQSLRVRKVLRFRGLSKQLMGKYGAVDLQTYVLFNRKPAGPAATELQVFHFETALEGVMKLLGPLGYLVVEFPESCHCVKL